MKGVFVGYDYDSATYRVYKPETRNVVSSGNVIFVKENHASKVYIDLNPCNQEAVKDLDKTSDSDVFESADSSEIQSESSEDYADSLSLSDDHSNSPNLERRTLRDRRTLKPPERYDPSVSSKGSRINLAMIGEHNDPVLINELTAAIIGEVEDISTAAALKNEK